ncbi:MAG: ABC transporter ATP-binding protein/permease [Acidobacteriota bacterium]|nr:ABC transporter ATP-binding protein/permease [Acidobacteriota bacterium]
MTSRLKLLLKRLFNSLLYLPRTLALVWQAARLWTVGWVALLIGQGMLPAVLVWCTKALVDSFVEASRVPGGPARLRPILLYAALAGAAMLLIELFHRIGNYVRTAQSDLLKDHISALIQRKSAEVDFAFYEMPEYHDHLHRARSDASYRPIELLENLGGLLQGAVTLLALLVVLLPYGWWLPLSLLAATVPLAIGVMVNIMRRYNWQRSITEAERRTWYYDWVLTATETAAEVRLFGLSEHFRNAYGQLRARLRDGQLALVKREVVLEFLAGLFALAITGATLGWMGWQALQGAATLGTLALFYQAFNQGQQLLRSLVGNFSGCYSNALFLGDLFEFLDLQPKVIEPENPLPAPVELVCGIEFDQVSFCYPGSERAALDNFNLTIPAGQITAIVGLNGAGKTTLIKLLCRLYDPDAGTITMDGVDLQQMSLASLRRAITVLFQQPVHYNTTVAENIGLGQIEQMNPPGSAIEGAAGERIRAAAEDAGAAEIINRLPDGYDTMLGKWFSDGTELSGGEWQRLALARAFARSAPIVLLDEPTSAMDSWAEADWLRRFRGAMTGRTVIIITHRFTTAMQADRIHVMNEGQIIESGTHGDLLALSGLYAESWIAQVRGVDK